MKCVLALDQGTTSSRSLVIASDGSVVASAQREFRQIYPSPGAVEHDPEDIWTSQIDTATEAWQHATSVGHSVEAIGITNQRETTILWDRSTGKPVGNAIVWQSRISEPICRRLKNDGLEALVREKTGLRLDPYFSGTKIAHLLETIPGLRERAERGEIAFGTVDSFLIYRLTGGRCHVTDVSNASRTLLMNLETLQWDDELLRALSIPRGLLPKIVDSSGVIGETQTPFFGGTSLRVSGIAGDQQAATFGQACFSPGDAKNTYGTGCFMLMNIGARPKASTHGLLTTVGWRVGGETVYCLEGSVFVAGAAIQWLRDGLGLISRSEDVEKLAASVADSDGCVFVPALVGLGAPYWDPHARGAFFGITRGTTKAHFARAAVEAMAFQTRDVLDAMRQDSSLPLSSLRVDGGAVRNNALLQFQADILGVRVLRPRINESTALGAGYLAGLAVGLWSSEREIASHWAHDAEFRPLMPDAEVRARYLAWCDAVERVRSR